MTATSICVTVPGTPRTKKNSPIIVGGRGERLSEESLFRLISRGMQARLSAEVIASQVFAESQRIEAGHGHPKLLPSEAYRAWFRDAMQYSLLIKAELRESGIIDLPIRGDVNVACLVYTETLQQGDLLGYLEGVADWMQAPRNRAFNGIPKRIRDGAGLIDDDKQIRAWNGSELRLDRDNPRVEIEITRLDSQVSLF